MFRVIALVGIAIIIFNIIIEGVIFVDFKSIAKAIAIYLFFSAIFMAIPMIIFIIYAAPIYFENSKNQLLWIEKIRKMKINHDKLTKNYIDQYHIYMPKWQVYLNKIIEYVNISNNNKEFNRHIGEFSTCFQTLIGKFEALWREVEFRANMELEVTNRSEIIAMFAVAFSETLANDPLSGWLQVYGGHVKMEMETFPKLDSADNYKMMSRFISAMEGAASRRKKGEEGDFYLQNDERLLAVMPFLPKITYASVSAQWDAFLLSGPLPPKPERPPAPANLLVDEKDGGRPIPIERVKFRL